jgi:hypothetical protein
LPQAGHAYFLVVRFLVLVPCRVTPGVAIRRGFVTVKPARSLGLVKSEPREKPEITAEEEGIIRKERINQPEWMRVGFEIAIAIRCRLRETAMDFHNIDFENHGISCTQKRVFRLGKIGCNVAGPKGTDGNRVGELLRSWFGADAGMRGTGFKVVFRRSAEGWSFTPVPAPARHHPVEFPHLQPYNPSELGIFRVERPGCLWWFVPAF